MKRIYLRVLTLATMVVFAAGCSQKEEAPQPSASAPTKAAVMPKNHTVAVRYYLKPASSTTPLPTTEPSIEVIYERVIPNGTLGYKLLGPDAHLYDSSITTAVQEVTLAPISTYAGDVKPNITITIWEEKPLATGAEASYEVICELLVDGKIVGGATYSVTAGQNPLPFVIAQTAVAH